VAEFIICLAVALAVLMMQLPQPQAVLEAGVQEEIMPLTLQVELPIQAAAVAHLGV
jgi:hypothetical protein